MNNVLALLLSMLIQSAMDRFFSSSDPTSHVFPSLAPIEEESWVEIVELINRPSTPLSMSVLDAASTFLAHQNVLPAAPSSAASN